MKISEDNLALQALSSIFDVVYVGVLWLVCCLGIVTIGASTTAAYYTMVKVVRRKRGYIHKEFFGCFKRNFKQSVGLSLLVVFVAVLIYCDYEILWTSTKEWAGMLVIVITVAGALLYGMLFYAFPLLSRFENTNLGIIKLSALLTVRYLPLSALYVITAIGCIYLGMFFLQIALFLPGIYLFFMSLSMEKILRKLMPEVDEDSEEADAWYNEKPERFSFRKRKKNED